MLFKLYMEGNYYKYEFVIFIQKFLSFIDYLTFVDIYFIIHTNLLQFVVL